MLFVLQLHRFVTFGKEGVIDVNGPAEVAPTEGGERIKATFTEAELKWNGLRCDGQHMQLVTMALCGCHCTVQ